MIETGRSARPWVRQAALVISFAVGPIWAGFVLVGSRAVPGLLSGLLGWALALFLTDRATRIRERSARAAVREHRDPGPGLRAEADAQARAMLAVPAADRWVPGLLLGGLAVACVVVAVVRQDLSVAFPAPLLVALAVATFVLRRRTEAAADRWLTDPPVTARDEDVR